MKSGNVKTILIAVIRYGMLAGVLAFGGWYIYTHYDHFAGQVHLTAYNITLLTALSLLTILLESIRLRKQIAKLGYLMSIPTSWHVFTVLQALNHLVVKAGTFSTGYYLSRRYRISFHAYCAFVMTYVVIMVLSSGLTGLIAVLISYLFGLSVDPFLLLFFLSVIGSGAGFIMLASLKIPLPRLPDIIMKLIEAWREIYSDYKMVFGLLVIEVFYFSTCALRFYIAIRMFSVDISILDAVTVVTVGNFLRVASIVPGGLGLAEIASGWTSAVIGGDAGISGLAAGFDRLIYVALIMIFGGIGFLTLSGRNEFHRPYEYEDV